MDWEVFYARFREPDFVPGYEIHNRLGGGSFGEVYKARKASIGKSYAIKFLKIDGEEQRDAAMRELEQVRHFAALDHPNLVSIEDMGEAAGVPYLIMGYAGEDTLARRLKAARLDEATALLYFVQVCRGVLALHDRRLVHFDLKPSNVFLKGDVARVGDYGLSKMMADGRSTLSFGRGTPQYMAPEMLKNRADHRADVYSLGVLLYESLSGRIPYEGVIPGAFHVREDDLAPPFPADFPARLKPVVIGCLRLSPEHRYGSVADVLNALGHSARIGDSARVQRETTQTPTSTATPPRAPSTTVTEVTPTRSEARQTAAELTRGAVEVARGVWDGLRPGASTPPRAPAASTATPGVPAVPAASTAPPAGHGTNTVLASNKAEPTPTSSSAPGTPVHKTPLTNSPPTVGSIPETNPSSPVAPRPRHESDTTGRAMPGPDSALSWGTRGDSPTPYVQRALATVRGRSGAPEDSDILVLHTLTGAAPVAAAQASSTHPDPGATIPVPPSGPGGWIGTLWATTRLALEVFLVLARWLFATGRAAIARGSSRASGAFARLMLGTLRITLFAVGLALLGAVTTLVAYFLLRGNSEG